MAKSHRSHEFAGERTYRRQASGKRNRVAKHEGGSSALPAPSAKSSRPRRRQAKVELPERKQAQNKPEAKPQTQASTEQPKDKPVAERKVDTEKAYRTTSSQSGMASYYGSDPARRRLPAHASTRVP